MIQKDMMGSQYVNELLVSLKEDVDKYAPQLPLTREMANSSTGSIKQPPIPT